MLELFSMPLYTKFLFDLYKKLRVAFIYDTNIEYQIWGFYYSLLLSYDDSRHTDAHTKTQKHTVQTLKMWVSYSGDLITYKSIKISISKILSPPKKTFSSIAWVTEDKKVFKELISVTGFFHCFLNTK